MSLEFRNKVMARMLNMGIYSLIKNEYMVIKAIRLLIWKSMYNGKIRKPGTRFQGSSKGRVMKETGTDN